MAFFTKKQSADGPVLYRLTNEERLQCARIWAEIGADIRPRYGLKGSRVIEYFHKHCYSMSQFFKESVRD